MKRIRGLKLSGIFVYIALKIIKFCLYLKNVFTLMYLHGTIGIDENSRIQLGYWQH